MKQRLGILIVLLLLLLTLVGLNAASYVQKEKPPDSEASANRSTFNSGATGTSGFYSLLSETGRKVVRWQEPPAALSNDKGNIPAVFVLTGALRREFSTDDTEQLLQWVSGGGRLVIIDRHPPESLLTTTANWRISANESERLEIFSADPSDPQQMIGDTHVSKPVQPTLLTQDVGAIQPSLFAASIQFERFAEDSDKESQDKNPPQRKKIATVESPSQTGPVVHFMSHEKNLLADVPYGNGKIIYLADPYIVSNGGISLADNVQMAINMVSSPNGVVAFDEYHQGYGSSRNQFVQFFEGTPVIAMFLQAALLVALVFFSQSRRFARPIAEPETDRLSKLEYISAMAELQQRMNAYDLAIENIYTDFRRRVTRLFGLDALRAKSDEMAERIAERTGINEMRVNEILFKCEEIIRGEPTNRKEVVELSAAIRDLEMKLGLGRSSKKEG